VELIERIEEKQGLLLLEALHVFSEHAADEETRLKIYDCMLKFVGKVSADASLVRGMVATLLHVPFP
jgi:hypothetical protein